MVFKKGFKELSLGKQMRFLFITSSMLICAVLIVITKYQIDWISNDMISESSSVYEDRILAQMRALAIVRGEYYKSELSNYAAFVMGLKEIDEMFHGFVPSYPTNPFQTSTAYSYLNATYDTVYDFGVYFTRLPMTDEAYSLMDIESCFNKIYPAMYDANTWGYYQGYEVDDIYMYYPGYPMSTLSYNPKVREWYYKAYQNEGTVQITEPYQDSSSGNWVITVSKAITSQSQTIGVAGYDMVINNFISIIANTTILKEGFILLVSRGGMMLNIPESWEASSIGNQTIKIFDTSYTGISNTQWEMIQNLTDGELFIFTDVYQTEYKLIKQGIQPFYDSNTTTHYLLICANSQELKNVEKSIEDTANNIYNYCFWTIMIIGTITFVSIVVLITVEVGKFEEKLKRVERAAKSIMVRALFDDVTKNVNVKNLMVNVGGIENMARAFLFKVEKLREEESKWSDENKGRTRPCDVFLYKDWCEGVFPYNFYFEREIALRNALVNLKTAKYLKED